MRNDYYDKLLKKRLTVKSLSLLKSAVIEEKTIGIKTIFKIFAEKIERDLLY
jgi:hypothetical protein